MNDVSRGPTVEILITILRKLLKNFGRIGDIQRSGQPGKIRLWVHYILFPFKSVINLSYKADYDADDPMEEAFCKKRNIPYFIYGFGAGGPQPYEKDAEDILDLIDRVPKPVWIHCEGGKDRTGGIVMGWLKRKGFSYTSIIEQACKYRIPAEDWIKWAMGR